MSTTLQSFVPLFRKEVVKLSACSFDQPLYIEAVRSDIAKYEVLVPELSWALGFFRDHLEEKPLLWNVFTQLCQEIEVCAFVCIFSC